MKIVETMSTIEAEQNELTHLLDEDEYDPCQEDEIICTQSTRGQRLSFDEQCKDLARFKRIQSEQSGKAKMI